MVGSTCSQWRRFLLEIGGTSAEGASFDRGAEGSRVWGGDVPLHTGREVWEGVTAAPLQKIFRSVSSKRWVLLHSWWYFCSWIEWKLVRPLSGMHWLVTFWSHLKLKSLFLKMTIHDKRHVRKKILFASWTCCPCTEMPEANWKWGHKFRCKAPKFFYCPPHFSAVPPPSLGALHTPGGHKDGQS